MSYNWTIISLKKVLCYTLLHPLPQSLLFCVLFGLFQFLFFLFNIQLWILDKMHSFSYFKSELWKRLYFRDKVIFIIFSTHQIWDLDSTKIQISTVLFVIVANIFHFDYQYTFTAPNIANPRLISSTFCVMSLLFWDIYVKILKSLDDWLFRVILLLGDAPSSEFALL